MSKILSFLGIIKKSGNLILGMDPVKENFLKKKIKSILVTSDISENSLKKLKNTVNQGEVNIIKLKYVKEDIELSVGKSSAILGILDEGMANQVINLVSEDNREECSL